MVVRPVLAAPFERMKQQKRRQQSSVGDHLPLHCVLSQASGQVGGIAGAQLGRMALVGHLGDWFLPTPVFRWLADVREGPVGLRVVLLHQLLHCLAGDIRSGSGVLAVSDDNAHHPFVLLLDFIRQINALLNGVKEGSSPTRVVVARAKRLNEV